MGPGVSRLLMCRRYVVPYRGSNRNEMADLHAAIDKRNESDRLLGHSR